MSETFIIDCVQCKAKVAAIQKSCEQRSYYDDEIGEPYGQRVYIGTCPRCKLILVGESEQIYFEGHNYYEDGWSDVVRVFPNPPKRFSSHRVPRIAVASLEEADKSFQAGAYMAACVMLGRTLEAVCNGALGITEEKKKLILAKGIQELLNNKIIDTRLFEWSQQLRAFRNVAAHAGEAQISREDAEDLQTFVYAIIEYIYDLADRYEEFKARLEENKKITADKKAKAAKKT
jgi:hypothetical protein